MNTLIKILLGALGVVALVFVAIAIAVAFVFEPNDYRPFLVDSVKSATGRGFTLDGDLELKLFPCCGVRVGAATLGNPPGFPADERFASIDSASVSVKIWPLLTRREVQVGTVTLDGADVRLVELADGRSNWTFESEDPGTAPATDGDASIASLTIEGLNVRGGKVAYAGADGSRYSARDILMDAGAIGGNAPVPVAVKLTARDERAGTEAEIALNGVLAMEGARVTLAEPQLAIQATGDVIPAAQAGIDLTAASLSYDSTEAAGRIQALAAAVSLPGARVELSGNVDLGEDSVTGSGEFRIAEGNLRSLLAAMPELGYAPSGAEALKHLTGRGRWELTPTGATLSDLDLALDGSRMTGSAGVTSFDTGAATASIRIDRVNVDDYLPREDAGSATGAPADPTEVPFESLDGLLVDADLKVGELEAGGMVLKDLDARVKQDGRSLAVALESGLFGGRFRLTGSGNPAGASPALAGQLEIISISPRNVLTALGETVETAGAEALTRLSGSTRFRLGRRSLALDEMSWQLDATRLTGTLGIDGFDAPATRFDLALDRMNLDDYLAPDAAEDAAAEDAADAEIPVELIRELNLSGRLKAGALKVMDLDLANVEATVLARDGVLRLEPVAANLYGGTYKGNIVIDATGARSRLSLDQELSSVQVGQVLNALVGTDRIAGALTLKLTGSGAGNTQQELLKGLTGNLSFNLSDGVYHGMDIAYEIENAQSLLRRSAAPERPNQKETPIRALSFSGGIVDGMLGSDNLNAEIPHVKLGGKGGFNLVERTIDYQLNALVLKSADNAADSRLKALAGSTIPIAITGALADPKVGVDLKGLVANTVKERARDELVKRLGLNEGKPTSGGSATTGADTPTTAPAPVGVDEPPAELAAETATATGPEAVPETAREEQAAPQPSPRDLLERGLRDLLKKPKPEAEGSGG